MSMDADGKLKAERAINQVKERGHTNLSGGLLAAMEILYRVKSSEASLVESVLLFTDGKANVGIRDNDALVKATKWVAGHCINIIHKAVRISKALCSYY